MHFKALCYKNCILWKRNQCLSICEIVLPVFLMGVMVLFRVLIVPDQNDPKSYIRHGELLSYKVADTIIDDNLFSPITNFFACLKDQRAQAGYVGFTSAEVTDIHSRIAPHQGVLPLNPREFQTHTDYKNYVTASNYWATGTTDTLSPFCYVIENAGSSGNYEFKIHVSDFLDNQNDITRQSPSTDTEILGIIEQNPSEEDYEFYRDGGFMLLMNILGDWVLEKETSISSASLKLGFAPLKTESFENDSIFQFAVAGMLPLFAVIIWVLPLVRFVAGMVAEKQARIKEAMRIMGMSESAYNLSWFVYFLIITFTMTLFLTIIGIPTYFRKSNPLIIFLIFMSFSLSIYSISFFVQAIFSKPRNAIIVAIILYFLTYFMSGFMLDPNVAPALKYLSSIAPPIGIALVSNNLGAFEGSSTGTQFSNWNSDYQNYRITGFIGMMIFDFVFFWLLGWYLENVIPHEWGVKRSACFCFTRKYWCSSRKRSDNPAFNRGRSIVREDQGHHTQQDPELFQEVAAGLKAQEAEGECLTIRNLQKLYSTGKKAVDGLNVEMYNGQIFALLGHNGAGKTTTISILTGMLSASGGHAFLGRINMFEDLTELRKQIGLCPQHDILFKSLTPAQHLNFYAMIKGIKDPKVRKQQIQSTLQKIDLYHKKTAQAKDLSGGQKRKLSVGIALVGNSRLVLLDEPSSGMDLTARRKLWNMLKDEKKGRVIVLTTHFMDEADILGDRIGIMADGKLRCCGSSLFLKNKFGVGYRLSVVKKSNEPNPQLDNFVTNHIETALKLSDISAEVIYQLPLDQSAKFGGFFKELDQNLVTLGVAEYGVAVTTLQEVFLTVGRGDQIEKVRRGTTVKQDAFDHSLKDDEENHFDMNQKIQDYSIAQEQETRPCHRFCGHLSAQINKRFIIYKRNVTTLFIELVIPILFVLAGLCFTLVQFFFDAPAYSLLPSTQLPTPSPVYISSNANSFSQNFDSNQVDPRLLTYTTDANQTTDLISFDNTLFDLRANLGQTVYGAFYLVDPTFAANNYEYVVLSNIRDTHSISVMTAQLIEATVRMASSNSNVNVKFVNEPFPILSKIKARKSGADGSTIALMFIIAFAILPGSIVRELVLERRTSVYHQQLVSGANKCAYWTGNYIMDVTRNYLTILLTVALMFAFDLQIPFGWLMVLLYPFPVVALTHFYAVLPISEGAAQTISNISHMIVGSFLAIAVFFLRFFDSTKDTGVGIMWAMRWFPPFTLGDGFMNSAGFQGLNGHKASSDSEYFQMDSLGGDIIFYPISTFIFLFIVYLVESRVLCSCQKKESLYRPLDGHFKNEFPQIDDDVEKERQRVAQSADQHYHQQEHSTNAIQIDDGESLEVKVKDLQKNYGKGKKQVKAVKYLNFGLSFGQCFALLGVNGAGKSSTFKTLTGEVNFQHGDVQIHKYRVQSQFNKVRKYIGYCPQIDTLIPDMNVREHLYFHAVLKNIPKSKRKDLIEKVMSEMDLNEYAKIRSKSLSGGNKRKLCVAIAMLGNPPIILLDEPSTGIDPKAKRFMWDIISRISKKRKQSAVVLTTHSMEEAEALSTKIGIMVKGQFKCFGNSQHLKNKYSNGYELDFKIKEPSEEQVIQTLRNLGMELNTRVNKDNLGQVLQKYGAQVAIQREGQGSDIYKAIIDKGYINASELYLWAFVEHNGMLLLQDLVKLYPSVEIAEHFFSFFKFRIRPDRANFSIGQLFEVIEQRKKAYSIAEYSVSQTTLEQIFNTFALEGGSIDD